MTKPIQDAALQVAQLRTQARERLAATQQQPGPERNALIRATAATQLLTVAEIARAVGLTHQRIYQILNRKD